MQKHLEQVAADLDEREKKIIEREVNAISGFLTQRRESEKLLEAEVAKLQIELSALSAQVVEEQANRGRQRTQERLELDRELTQRRAEGEAELFQKNSSFEADIQKQRDTLENSDNNCPTCALTLSCSAQF